MKSEAADGIRHRGKILIAEGTEGVKSIRRSPCCSATVKALRYRFGPAAKAEAPKEEVKEA